MVISDFIGRSLMQHDSNMCGFLIWSLLIPLLSLVLVFRFALISSNRKLIFFFLLFFQWPEKSRNKVYYRVCIQSLETSLQQTTTCNVHSHLFPVHIPMSKCLKRLCIVDLWAASSIMLKLVRLVEVERKCASMEEEVFYQARLKLRLHSLWIMKFWEPAKSILLHHFSFL